MATSSDPSPVRGGDGSGDSTKVPGLARFFFRLVLAVLVVLAVVTVISPALVSVLLFHPDRTDPGLPPPLAGVAGEDLTLETEDGVAIHGWFWDAGPGRPAVVLYHGNAGNIAGRTPMAHGFVSRGVSVLLLEYRGYGRSQGEASEEGLYRDGETGWDFLQARAGGADRVVVFGRSLGATVATHVALRRAVPGVILEAAFTSLDGIGKAVYPFLPSFVFRGLRGRFDNLGRIARLEGRRLLVVHGTRDGIVPFAMGEALFREAREPKAWYPVEDAGHNDVFVVGGPPYFDRLVHFVEEVTGGPVEEPDEAPGSAGEK